MSEWIPVTERLPKEEVLCCNIRGDMLIGYVGEDEYGYMAEGDGVILEEVVAWMPLPKPYEVKEE